MKSFQIFSLQNIWHNAFSPLLCSSISFDIILVNSIGQNSENVWQQLSHTCGKFKICNPPVGWICTYLLYTFCQFVPKLPLSHIIINCCLLVLSTCHVACHHISCINMLGECQDCPPQKCPLSLLHVYQHILIPDLIEIFSHFIKFLFPWGLLRLYYEQPQNFAPRRVMCSVHHVVAFGLCQEPLAL